MKKNADSKEQSCCSSIIDWIEFRLPIFSAMRHSLVEYRTPKNLSYLWNMGSLAGICLVIQILTGIFLAMYYTPHVDHAFDSVERIMRDVNYGWLIRYTHAVGASMFFAVVFIHIFRGLYYGSYKYPRELLWWLGVFILLAMMATAFMGYVLPWGQMSFWGATVITNLFSAIPVIGPKIVTWLWGGFSVDNPTLNRFFALHYLMPFIIVGLVAVHLVALHIHGSNNPTGVDVKSEKDTVPFHPYYTVKDMAGLGFFLLIFFGFVFYSPNSLGHPDNYIPADPMVTPAHIVPEWYFLPFYAILRAVPDKLLGVVAMFGSILVLLALPWLDTSKVRSAAYRPLYKLFFWLFVVNCVVLGYCGSQPPEGIFVIVSRLATAYYFAFFLVIMPLLGKFEKTKPLPESISAAASKHLAIAAAIILLGFGTANASSGGVHNKQIPWKFDGIMGNVDVQSAQRGYQVYKQVCASCHSLKRVAYRNLAEIGFSEAEIKAIAAEYKVQDGPNDEGEMFERPARPSDRFNSPFANEKAARASNNGAYPPDLSLIIKARPDGANYLYSLLTGYEEPPSDIEVPDGMYYNPHFPGGKLAMPAPLAKDAVQYADGTEASVDQMSRDLVNFLQWTAEPEMRHRKEMGLKVLIFLAITTIFMFGAKKRTWKSVK